MTTQGAVHDVGRAAPSEPRDRARSAEIAPVLPPGSGERFAGYGVMGLPFASGHYLAMRRFTASSVGPDYAAVWHRDPAGRWTIHASAPPEVSCARYVGDAVAATHTGPVEVEWTGPRAFTVRIPGVLTWDVELAASPVTRVLGAIGSLLPAGSSRATGLLRAMGLMVGPALAAGTVRLTGTTPNGQHFGAVPRRVWLISRSTAVLHGEDLGASAPLPAQERLGDIYLPQRGLFFADAETAFTPLGHGLH